MTARARGSGQSFGRTLQSNEIRAPASRAASIAANTVSQALALIAWLIPDTCSTGRRSNHRQRKIRRAHAAGRGTGAKIAELVAIGAVGDKVDAGIGVGVDRHAAGIDALLLPELEELAAERIVAQARDVAATAPRAVRLR